MKVCLNCDIQFESKDHRSKFCSKSCSATHTNKRRLKKSYAQSTKYCVVCSKVLLQYQTKFCSSVCDGKSKTMTTEAKILNGEQVAINVLRKYLFSIRPNLCEICKGSEWYGNPMPLVMDHIDGNALNNNLTNLRLICPNCDRFTPTFGARNRGKGRQSLGIKRYDKYDK